MRQRNDEIEKKTRTVDLLNRKLEKILFSADGETNLGPLEATIANLSHEITRKGVESKDLQRLWINLQTELVTKQISNGTLSEAHARLTSDYSILFQKKVRLELELGRETKEVRSALDLPFACTRPSAIQWLPLIQMKDIDRTMASLNQDMQRLNSLISKNTELSVLLEDETFNLESSILAELRELETVAVKLEGSIDSAAAAKKNTIADILETERQIMLWDRKIQLEKEMQEMLDPTVGQVRISLRGRRAPGCCLCTWEAVHSGPESCADAHERAERGGGDEERDPPHGTASRRPAADQGAADERARARHFKARRHLQQGPRRNGQLQEARLQDDREAAREED